MQYGRLYYGKHPQYKEIKWWIWLIVAVAVLSIATYFLTGNLRAYSKAKSLEDDELYTQALQIYATIPDYRDANERFNNCKYQLASGLQNDGVYGEAIAAFDEISDYADSAEQIQYCKYQLALALEASNDYSKAQEAFEALGAYSDAPLHVNECMYQQALAQEVAGNYAEAQVLYEKLGQYSKAPDHLLVCKYNIAKQMEADGEYSSALHIFEELNDYQDSQDRYMLCKYNIAIAFLSDDQFQDAATLFSQLPQYQDSDAQLLLCQEKLAQMLFDEGKAKEAQQLLMEIKSPSMADLLRKCNDVCFLPDLVTALNARWGYPEVDASVLSDSQLIEYYTELVSSELSILAMYGDAEFSDALLAQYAYGYINALQNQLIGITEFYGVNQELYEEYWEANGYGKRAQMLYWINRKYGISTKYPDVLKEMVMLGQEYDMIVSVETMLTNELSTVSYHLANNNEYSVNIAPFELTNSTDYPIEYLNITANLLDANGNVVGQAYLYYGNAIKAGQHIKTDNGYISDKFTKLEFVCEYTVTNGTYYDQGKVNVMPGEQFGWNGNITDGGVTAAGQPEFALEDVSASWDWNSSWTNKLYTPIVKFSVKNTGTASADKVIVHCVFINEDRKEVWSEETVHVTSSMDAPLKAGYKKKAFIYSAVGFDMQPTSLPNIVVEIYVNDVLTQTLTMPQ